jgi:hypothetical protein
MIDLLKVFVAYHLFNSEFNSSDVIEPAYEFIFQPGVRNLCTYCQTSFNGLLNLVGEIFQLLRKVKAKLSINHIDCKPCSHRNSIQC